MRRPWRHLPIQQCDRGWLISGMRFFPATNRRRKALGALVRADAEKWWPIIKGLGIKAE
jgi:hypothetical protein